MALSAITLFARTCSCPVLNKKFTGAVGVARRQGWPRVVVTREVTASSGHTFSTEATKHIASSKAVVLCYALAALTLLTSCSSGSGDAAGDGDASTASTTAGAPSAYTAYSGTDPKPSPNPPPALGPANSIIVDPSFGSRILRVTDANTAGGSSLIPEDAGFVRTWNANSTALKLMTTTGASYWLEFDAAHFRMGALHRIDLNGAWEWSAVDPEILYSLNGSQLIRYNKSTKAVTNLGATPNGDPVRMHVAVVGQDSWVCSAAGAGSQNTYTKIFCVNPSNSESKLIDVVQRTVNGVSQHDPNWPTSASGQTLGVHSMFGSASGAWLGVTFHQGSWGGNGDAVFNLSTDTWSLVTNANHYWSGHVSMGNGKYVNGAGSINGMDSRGALVRDANNLMNATQFSFIMQPSSTVGWYDGEHSSWFNASTNPSAPVLFSRYNISTPPKALPWVGEIVLAATDGSDTVWRFAHNHNGGPVGFYAQSFAQISNDGRWAAFSSYWDGTLGASSGDFGLSTRIDTFIVELS